ncbi:hypothetical protein OG562_20260 [Streptomyces sp. NBC_01275]|uniref:hypothetical protein n=1 Tax=Streptomyces sp. NBC_01275 TaxID=2903807 RepID=UPI002259C254|nr:hypothetical protein [Streptomyces sp. NBC_01275]MCX4763260.1 hypothetical protein [Streptomyces sp. NBC_01275]
MTAIQIVRKYIEDRKSLGLTDPKPMRWGGFPPGNGRVQTVDFSRAPSVSPTC